MDGATTFCQRDNSSLFFQRFHGPVIAPSGLILLQPFAFQHFFAVGAFLPRRNPRTVTITIGRPALRRSGLFAVGLLVFRFLHLNYLLAGVVLILPLKRMRWIIMTISPVSDQISLSVEKRFFCDIPLLCRPNLTSDIPPGNRVL